MSAADRLKAFEGSKGGAAARMKEFEARGGKDVSGSGTQAIRSAGESIINSFLDLPEVIGARGVQGLLNVGRAATGQPMHMRPHGERLLPNPFGVELSGEKALAGLDSLTDVVDIPSVLSGQLGDALQAPGSYEENLVLQQQGKQENPTAHTLGDVLGPAFTMFNMKRMGAHSDGANKLSQLFGDKVDDIAKVAAVQKAETPTEYFKVLAAKLASSNADKTIVSTLGRAAETGAEAAFISLLEDSDPVESAAFFAVNQTVGDALFGAMKGLRGGSFTQTGANLAVLVGSGAALIQMLKTATPGGVDYILPSIETSFDKVLLGGMLLSGYALGGFGRTNPGGLTAQSSPVLADAWTSLRRGSVMSLVEQWNAADLADQAQIERVLNQVTHAPYTTPDAIQEALQNGTSIVDAVREGGDKAMEWLSAPEEVASVPVKRRRNRGIGFER